MAAEEDAENRGAGNAVALDVAVATALNHARSGNADAFLEEQRRLTRLQIARITVEDDRIEEQQRLQLSHLRMRRLADFTRVFMEGALALLVLAIVVALGVLVWQAHSAKGLVAEPFKMPPDFAAKGLDGTVLAQQLLDKLNRLVTEADVYDLRKPESIAGSWSENSKVQIPTTGISVADLSRLLRDWLGSETHVSGEVYREGTGIAVTVRVGSNPGTTFKGPESDLDHLLEMSARSLLKQVQIYSYVFLSLDWRTEDPDTYSVAKEVAERGPVDQRAYGALAMAGILLLKGDYRGALPPSDLAVRLAPRDPYPYYQRWDVDMALEHEETALFDGKMEADLLRANPGTIRGDASSEAIPQITGMIDELKGAYLDAIPQLQKAGEQKFDTYDAVAPIAIAHEFVFAHDTTSARRILSADPSLTDAFALTQFAVLGLGSLPGYEARAAMDDWRAAIADLSVTDQAILGEADLRNLRHTIVWPRLAYAWAQAGHQRDAEALIALTPLDCTPCLELRGRIAELGGKFGDAAHWFARATEFSPSIPLAYTDWGGMLLRRGDYDGAIAKFEQAHQTGPHFADPLELWGEALMQKNRSDLALEKFEEANKYAPRWGRLHLKWGEALFYLGREDEARAQVQAASGMDLSPTDQSRLARDVALVRD
jgi:tetratricopeptide (TPR) repeat protein